MGCINGDCGGSDEFDRTIVTGPCKVCQILDSDSSDKITKYCNPCGVYMCESCRYNPIRRGKAVVEDKIIQPLAAVTEKIIDKIKEGASNLVSSGSKKKKDHPTDEFGPGDIT
jgi:hypothetical protein